MKNYFEHNCHKCGLIDEARFIWAGPHIKQICNGCGFYVKFFNKALIPDVKIIRQLIWQVSNQDKELIEKAKSTMPIWLEGMKGLDGKMMYWGLYLEVRKHIHQQSQQA